MLQIVHCTLYQPIINLQFDDDGETNPHHDQEQPVSLSISISIYTIATDIDYIKTKTKKPKKEKTTIQPPTQFFFDKIRSIDLEIL